MNKSKLLYHEHQRSWTFHLLDVGKAHCVGLAVAHRPLLLKYGLLKDRRSSPNRRRDLRVPALVVTAAPR